MDEEQQKNIDTQRFADALEKLRPMVAKILEEHPIGEVELPTAIESIESMAQDPDLVIASAIAQVRICGIYGIDPLKFDDNVSRLATLYAGQSFTYFKNKLLERHKVEE